MCHTAVCVGFACAGKAVDGCAGCIVSCDIAEDVCANLCGDHYVNALVVVVSNHCVTVHDCDFCKTFFKCGEIPFN